ncbi:MAG: LacI family transcriptional regulator [Chloroflexota bacterium]|nr:LacI family transcriptional regulator [Chloroflexota bacterium]
MSRASLKDVAARAGVSFQTAGKALNGTGRVSAETRERILAAAAEIGYVPAALARDLLNRSTRTIGVVATDFSNAALAQHVVGIEREARRHGLLTIIGSVAAAGPDVEQYVRALIERRVDGIVTLAPVVEDNPRVGELLRGRVPTVSTHTVAGGGIPVVTPDNVQSAYLPTRHLASLGHRRIGTVTGPRDRRVAHARVHGYRQALADAGLPFDPEAVEEGDWDAIGGGWEAAHRLLDRRPDLTALYVHNDAMAIGVLGALRDRGRRVPDDCAVVGCDDLPIAAWTSPPLTTVRLPFVEAGETAVRMLLAEMAEPSADARPVTLPVQMVYRASSGGRWADAAAEPAPPAVTADAGEG